jgi:hypothetical protein
MYICIHRYFVTNVYIHNDMYVYITTLSFKTSDLERLLANADKQVPMYCVLYLTFKYFP